MIICYSKHFLVPNWWLFVIAKHFFMFKISCSPSWLEKFLFSSVKKVVHMRMYIFLCKKQMAWCGRSGVRREREREYMFISKARCSSLTSVSMYPSISQKRKKYKVQGRYKLKQQSFLAIVAQMYMQVFVAYTNLKLLVHLYSSYFLNPIFTL